MERRFPNASAGAGGYGLLVLVAAGLLLALVIGGPIYLYVGYIDIPNGHMAVLTKKTGLDLKNGEEIAPDDNYKGVQQAVLLDGQGRPWRNPYNWDWDVVPRIDIPRDKIGVAIRLFGDDLPYGEIIARDENHKGIVEEPLMPGLQTINAWVIGTSKRSRDNYAYHIELHDRVIIPAGFKGVVTRLTGAFPKDPNVLLVADGERGVQTTPKEPGTYPVNPYIERIDLVDCRSQRFDLTTDGELGFPSKDGFWVTLEGIIEFRVKPDQAPHVLVVYNETENDTKESTKLDTELISKVILPNARSFCRLRGSDHTGKEFIGETRAKFQEDFQKEMKQACDSQGVEVIQALITRISPPQKIALPVRERQIALQQEKQYGRQILQQESEKNLIVEKQMVDRKKKLIIAEQEVVKLTTEAERAKEVAIIEADQRLSVAEFDLKAAEDLAAAVTARGTADAKVIEFENEAEAAGWKKAIKAFGGSGDEYARGVLLKKLAPAFRQMMVNTADSPLMDIFKQFSESSKSVSDKPVSASSNK